MPDTTAPPNTTKTTPWTTNVWLFSFYFVVSSQCQRGVLNNCFPYIQYMVFAGWCPNYISCWVMYGYVLRGHACMLVHLILTRIKVIHHSFTVFLHTQAFDHTSMFLVWVFKLEYPEIRECLVCFKILTTVAYKPNIYRSRCAEYESTTL